MARGIIRFLNIVLAGILAGVSFGIWIGFNPQGLSLSTYVEQQQNMLHGLRILMVVLVVAATIITLTSAFLQRRDRPVFVGLLAAAGFFIACIFITLLGNKPIDDVVLTWSSASLPSGWEDLRDRWWTLHVLRTIVELAGFGIVAWTSVRKD
jgi:cbb3-type cytochrome oxidase subunit 1